MDFMQLSRAAFFARGQEAARVSPDLMDSAENGRAQCCHSGLEHSCKILLQNPAAPAALLRRGGQGGEMQFGSRHFWENEKNAFF